MTEDTNLKHDFLIRTIVDVNRQHKIVQAAEWS
jgi:hypothetical protein